MPEGPLFAGGDGAGDGSSGAASSSKSKFPNSEPSPVVICQPAKAKKSAAPCPADKIKKNLETCDGGTNAWANAKKAVGKDPTFQVKKTSSGFAAETSGNNITISPDSDCCHATESLLFELHNVENQPRFKKIDSDATAGKYSREDYARANERVEYEGVKRSLETFDKCKDKWGGCGDGSRSFAEGSRTAKNFDDYYDHYLAKSHKDYYRGAWDKHYKAAYAAKKKGP